MVKNLLCGARDPSSIPGQGTKIAHALEQLSPYASTPKPMCHNWRVHVPQPKIPHDTTKA